MSKMKLHLMVFVLRFHSFSVLAQEFRAEHLSEALPQKRKLEMRISILEHQRI